MKTGTGLLVLALVMYTLMLIPSLLRAEKKPAIISAIFIALIWIVAIIMVTKGGV